MKTLIRLILVTLVSSSVAFADVVLQLETSGGGSGKNVGKMFVSGDKIRMENSGGDKAAQMIYRGDRQVMMTIDPQRKELVEITKQDMRKLAGAMNSAMASLEAQMANVPPQQRAMMKQMMGSMMNKMGGGKKPPAVVRATGETQVISGFKTQKYEVTRGGQKTREYWTASAKDVSNGSEVRAAFESMGNFFSDLLAAVSDGPMANVVDNPYAEFSKIDGVPILTKEYENGSGNRN